MRGCSIVAKPGPKSQDAYLHDMLEAAGLIRGYMAGVSFDEFWHNSEKRDAVALRISVLGESAHKIDKATERALASIPFKSILCWPSDHQMAARRADSSPPHGVNRQSELSGAGSR
jgi:hypothetical protein